MNNQRTCCKNGCKGLAQMQLNPKPIQITKEGGMKFEYKCDLCNRYLFVNVVKY